MDGFREVKEWQRISIVTYLDVKTVMQFATVRGSLIYCTSLLSFSEFRNDAHKFRSQYVTPFSLSKVSRKSIHTPYLAASTWAPFHLLASLEQAAYKTYISVSDPLVLTTLFVDVTPLRQLLRLCTIE
jgi:hypothetical protein